MATYTIGPTAFEYSEADSVENAENAYDSSASTYATVNMEDVDEHVYLYSFNFSKIPQGEVVTSITAKVKSCGSAEFGDCLIWLQSTADGTGVKLSADTTPDTSVSTKTLSLTADVATIMSYASTLSVAFYIDGLGGTFDIYAVYFTVTTAEVARNKIVYGNETLIDLTGDTATASDVASGKTFHLASGVQATGTLVASPSVATATTSSSTARTVSFTVSKEPSWFMLICAKTNTTARDARVQHMLYDGTTTTTYYGRQSAGSIRTSTTYGSFTYSSGTLTITVETAPYLGAADWELYYL